MSGPIMNTTNTSTEDKLKMINFIYHGFVSPNTATNGNSNTCNQSNSVNHSNNSSIINHIPQAQIFSEYPMSFNYNYSHSMNNSNYGNHSNHSSQENIKMQQMQQMHLSLNYNNLSNISNTSTVSNLSIESIESSEIIIYEKVSFPANVLEMNAGLLEDNYSSSDSDTSDEE